MHGVAVLLRSECIARQHVPAEEIQKSISHRQTCNKEKKQKPAAFLGSAPSLALRRNRGCSDMNCSASNCEACNSRERA